MPQAKEIVCKGKKYPSIKALAKAYRKHPVRLAYNLRNGWTPEEAVGLVKRKRKRQGRRIEVQGRTLPSVSAACEFFGLQEGTIAARLRSGYSPDDAFAGRLRPRRPSAMARKFEFEGHSYSSGTALAEAFGERWSNVSRRLVRGWSLSQALRVTTPPPRYRNFEGHARHHTWKQVRLGSDNNIEPVPDAQGFKLYEIRNTRNKKVYIGITVGALSDRLRQHISAAKTERRTALYNAIKKYGGSCFSIHLIRRDAKTFKELQNQEVEEIKKRRTVRHGYNSAYGGSIGTAKPISIQGIHFPSMQMAAEYYGISPTAFLLRLNRLKWTPEEAAELVARKKGGRKKIRVKGDVFPSLHAASRHYKVPYKIAHSRINRSKWSIEQALGLTPPPTTAKSAGVKVQFGGQKYRTIRQACAALNIHTATVSKHIASGLAPGAAIRKTLKNRRSQAPKE
jgi:hypothetical protein